MSELSEQARIWHRIQPHLDRALELGDLQRESFLEQLESSEPYIVRAIRQVLAERDTLDAQGFLDGAESPPSRAATLEGVRVGAYTIERLLGRGGMGEVWLAARSDGRFEGRCALKFLDANLRKGNK